MKQKFFKSKGEIAFRIWVYLVLLEEFKRYKNQEKINNLYNKVVTFSESEKVKSEATEEEKSALDFIVKELRARGAVIS